ncbi:hypothetical protein C922_05460 [Plasmodium inui San Antonio 1]|uniref:Uncharacterized protein n=1 Tax=Plasmodium inui San Antonio 1 TaxID=1237626 RepID=W6ZTB3_9APIC|nr:hypothetical protein C922_05460 [Plasmodium inui San Antonio 1]EUD64157.1 hypothetical protein C922_05460 [Plasmodium inui San Antonio 1]
MRGLYRAKTPTSGGEEKKATCREYLFLQKQKRREASKRGEMRANTTEASELGGRRTRSIWTCRSEALGDRSDEVERGELTSSRSLSSDQRRQG